MSELPSLRGVCWIETERFHPHWELLTAAQAQAQSHSHHSCTSSLPSPKQFSSITWREQPHCSWHGSSFLGWWGELPANANHIPAAGSGADVATQECPEAQTGCPWVPKAGHRHRANATCAELCVPLTLPTNMEITKGKARSPGAAGIPRAQLPVLLSSLPHPPGH